MKKYLLIGMVLLISCDKIDMKIEDKGHTCKYSLCPYKGVKIECFGEAVKDYIKEGFEAGIELENTDAYKIDMLHLSYPMEDYELLELRLNNLKK